MFVLESTTIFWLLILRPLNFPILGNFFKRQSTRLIFTGTRMLKKHTLIKEELCGQCSRLRIRNYYIITGFAQVLFYPHSFIMDWRCLCLSQLVLFFIDHWLLPCACLLCFASKLMLPDSHGNFHYNSCYPVLNKHSALCAFIFFFKNNLTVTIYMV